MKVKDKDKLTSVRVSEGHDRHVNIKAANIRLIVVNNNDVVVGVGSSCGHGNLRLNTATTLNKQEAQLSQRDRATPHVMNILLSHSRSLKVRQTDGHLATA